MYIQEIETCAHCGVTAADGDLGLVHNTLLQDEGWRWVAPMCHACFKEGKPHPRDKKRMAGISDGRLKRASRVDSSSVSETQGKCPKRRKKQPSAEGGLVSHDMPRATKYRQQLADRCTQGYSKNPWR